MVNLDPATVSCSTGGPGKASVPGGSAGGVGHQHVGRVGGHALDAVQHGVADRGGDAASIDVEGRGSVSENKAVRLVMI